MSQHAQAKNQRGSEVIRVFRLSHASADRRSCNTVVDRGCPTDTATRRPRRSYFYSHLYLCDIGAHSYGTGAAQFSMAPHLSNHVVDILADRLISSSVVASGRVTDAAIHRPRRSCLHSTTVLCRVPAHSHGTGDAHSSMARPVSTDRICRSAAAHIEQCYQLASARALPPTICSENTRLYVPCHNAPHWCECTRWFERHSRISACRTSILITISYAYA